MRLVVDFNAVFSALVSKGVTHRVFEFNSKYGTFEFVAPELLLEELESKKPKLLSLTKLSEDEYAIFLSAVISQISIFPVSEFVDKLKSAELINMDDAPYIALALKLDCPILSGDKELKGQTKVKVLSPKELLGMLK